MPNDVQKVAIMSLLIILAACGRTSGPAPVDNRAIDQSPVIDTSATQKAMTVNSKPPSSSAQAPMTKSQPSRIVVPAPRTGHVVAAGDTVYGVARRYGVPIRAIIEKNTLSPPYKLKVGQRLRIPPPQYHRVQAGESVYSIAQLYDLGLSQLVRENDLQQPYIIQPGQILRLPTSEIATPVIATTTSPEARTKTVKTAQGVIPIPRLKPGSGGRVPQQVYGESSSAPPPPRSGRRFAWPVNGKIISQFGGKTGGRYNDGINIRARSGTAIRAAENGVVAYSGNELPGFGNLLLIRHDGGWMTAYAHNQENFVKPGQRVKRGQLVARVGESGSVDQAQLHFEVRKGKRAVDPLRYLSSSTLKLSALVD